MKLQVPTGFTGDVHLHGRSFVVDNKGQTDIPDDCISSKLWADGFTVVHAIAEKPAIEEGPLKQKTEVSVAGKDKL